MRIAHYKQVDAQEKELIRAQGRVVATPCCDHVSYREDARSFEPRQVWNKQNEEYLIDPKPLSRWKYEENSVVCTVVKVKKQNKGRKKKLCGASALVRHS